MTIFLYLLYIVAVLFGLYYIQLLFFQMVARFEWFFPLWEALPFEVMIYLFILVLLLMAAIIYFMKDDAILPLILLLHIPWLIFAPLWFVPSVPLLLFYVFLHYQQHPMRHPLILLILGYVVTPWAPSFGYLILAWGWGWFANSILETKKRRI